MQKQRLKAFKVRKERFQKLRRAVGARRSHLVLRTGGTAALVYGQANTRVSNSMLLAQRQAVAAASVHRGAGDLDLTLILADGGPHGKADPAFAAHEDPIGMWAEAVWCMWLPRSALTKLAAHAIRSLVSLSSPWASVVGPAGAFVASAQRLGWTIENALTVRTDCGTTLDLCRDSPAHVRSEVKAAVWRWRWRKVEEKIPALHSGQGGHGAHLHPIFRLLQSRPSVNWGPQEQGALRSVVANRQWPQARLYSAGKVASRNCRLCVGLGFCNEEETLEALGYHASSRLDLPSDARATAEDGSKLAASESQESHSP